MSKLLIESGTLAMGVTTTLFTFVPESFFGKYKMLLDVSDEIHIIVNRIIVFLGIFVISIIATGIVCLLKRSVHIEGKNYCIKIKYGDLLKRKKCRRVIPFDECFTITVGDRPQDVKPDSICGQYLKKEPIKDMQALLDEAQIKPQNNKSNFQNKDAYASGTLVPRGKDLLLAFAKLDKDGLGWISRDEYLEALELLWKEINKYYGQKDVCISILGAGLTRMEGESLTQQELLDLIIYSYKITSYKIKLPNKLYIICKRNEGFSLNKICEM